MKQLWLYKPFIKKTNKEKTNCCFRPCGHYKSLTNWSSHEEHCGECGCRIASACMYFQTRLLLPELLNPLKPSSDWLGAENRTVFSEFCFHEATM